MSKTQSQLVEFALRKAGALAANEPVDAEDDQLVDAIYTSLLELLRDDGLLFWDADFIPEIVFLPLVKVLAYEIMPEFAMPRTPQDKVDLQIEGMRDLRKIVSKRKSSEPVQAQYF
jgi:hypothetical protein